MEKMISDIGNRIKEQFNPIKVLLFGSYAYGNTKSGSDIDLFVIMETDIPVKKQACLIRRTIEDIAPIDIIVRTPEQIDERLKIGDYFVKQIIQKGIEL